MSSNTPHKQPIGPASGDTPGDAQQHTTPATRPHHESSLTSTAPLPLSMTCAPFGATPAVSECASRLNATLSSQDVKLADSTPSAVHAARMKRAIAAHRSRPHRIAVDEAYNDKDLTAWQRVCLFLHDSKQTLKLVRVLFPLAVRDIKERTCAYVLGFLSIFVVVIFCTVLFSIMDAMPLAFMQLGENQQGQIDLRITNGGALWYGQSLNYTYLRHLFPDNTELGMHAPRITFEAQIVNARHCTPPTTSAAMWEFCGSPNDCIEHYCPGANRSNSNAFAIDEPREARMNLGDDLHFTMPGRYAVILSQRTAAAAGNVRPGDEVFITGSLSKQLRQALSPIGYNGDFITKLLVARVVAPSDKKFAGATNFAIFDYHEFMRIFADGASPQLSPEARDYLVNFNPEECASEVNFNLPGAERRRAYASTRYPVIRRRVTNWALKIVSPIGYNQIAADTPIVSFLNSVSMYTMFIGLVISLIVLGLAFLSIVLIYAILSVGVETRTYALGIQRMVGFTRENTAATLLFNVYLFTIPAWGCGLGAGQGVYIAVRNIFQSIFSVPLPIAIAPSSVGWSTLVAMVIPLIAAFFPVMTMMTLRLPDALNATRNRAVGVIYKIKRNDDPKLNVAMLCLGILFALCGFLVYYLLPVSLIRNDLTVMFYIFFAVLVGMLAGLVLLVSNCERIVERCVAYFFLFWESKVVFRVMLQNLSAHRLRNNKTTLMYSMSVAFVIFVTVAFTIELGSFQDQQLSQLGGEIRIKMSDVSFEDAVDLLEKLTTTLKPRYASGISYIWNAITPKNMETYYQLSSVGRYRQASRSLVPLPPSYLEIVNKKYLNVGHYAAAGKKYGLVGTMYSKEGANRVIMSGSSYDTLGLTSMDDYAVLKVTHRMGNVSHLVRTAAVLNSVPALRASKYRGRYGDTMTSITNALRLSGNPGMSVLRTQINTIVIRVPHSADVSRAARLVQSTLDTQNIGGMVDDVDTATDTMATANQILQLFFILVELMVLIICFFCLMSSMTANVLNSSKEIGILLCLGMSHFQIYRVFIWESFVLVVASGVLGLLVGVLVAYTMLLQNGLFTQLDQSFPFPYIQLCIIVGVGFVSALASSISPVAYLLNMPSITQILRHMLN